MIGFFPDPYPDELLYSVCARYQEQTQYPSYRSAIQELFGSINAIASIDLPNRLSHFVKILPLDHHYTVDSLIDNHTLFPFYNPFLPKDRQIQLREDMASTSTSVVHKRAGIMASKVSSPQWSRFCPVCLNEDRKKFGEGYWHRLHQVPGVEVCPTHRVFLQNSEIQATAREKRHGFISTEQSIAEIKFIDKLNFVDSSHLAFLNLATNVQWLLTHSSLNSDLQAVRNRYRVILANKGLATYTGMIRSQQLLEAFQSHYSVEILQILQSKLDQQDDANWLIRLVRNAKGVQHPLRHLLLIDFLQMTVEDFFQLSEDNSPFGFKNWLCLNPVCHYYQQRVIESYQLNHNARNGNPIGIFTCPNCKFAYQRTGPDTKPEDQSRIGRVKSYGSLWDDTLKNLWENSSLTMTEVADKLGFDWRTIQKQAVRLNLVFPRKGPTAKVTNLSVLPLQSSPKNLEISIEIIMSHRQEWLKILKSNPDAGRRELTKKFQKDYVWLKRHDTEWLQQNLPDRKLKKKPCSSGVNWQKRDIELVEKVKLAANKIKNKPGRPLQITVSSIGREIGQQAILQQQIHKLPITAQAIAEVIETQEEFAIRRIWWAADCFKAEGICPTRTNFLLRVSLGNVMKVKPKVKQALEEALQFLKLT